MNRRELISTAAAAMGTSALAGSQGSSRLSIRKGVELEMVNKPEGMSYAERFSLARDCGFESVECLTEDDPKKADQILEASRKAGLPIHSVMNRDHWKYPLSSPKAEDVAKCIRGMETSLANARLWRAATVLLVPAVVTPQVSYRQAWDRSVEQIRKLIPMAAEHKVVIAVEEVWNKFLLSPLEFARYVDEFNSPWVRAYFDVGNVVLYGYPQDWIRALGPRIVKLHFKDFAFRQRHTAEWVNLREGEIDWKEIHRALGEIGYKGDATVELAGGDGAYLKDVSKRFDLILEGA